MRKLIISLSILIAITIPVSLHAAFKVYLKNGRTITGVERIEEGERIKIYKQGISLELNKVDVIKIEEYKMTPVEEKPTSEKEKTLGQPESSTPAEVTPTDKEAIQRLRQRYEQVINKLERIEELEQRSMELQRAIHRKAYSPRKARMLKQEKKDVDRELEGLMMQKESLIKEKEELEDRLGQ